MPGEVDAVLVTVPLGEPDECGEPVNRVHRLPGLTVAMCDSSIPGQDDGLLDDTTLTWLDKVLSDGGDEPALVCFHHPLVAPGVVSTVLAPFESDAGTDYELPPSVAFPVLDDDRGLVTHFRSV